MQIGIISDIHDNLDALERALSMLKVRKITKILFCGDFCSPIPSRVLSNFEGEVFAVFGNGDGDRFAISNVAATKPNFHVMGEWAELELEGRKIAMTHYPIYGQALARTGDYDLVCSGHTHEKHLEMFGDTIWVNPGEIMGWKGESTCVIYDTKEHKIEFVSL